MKTLITHLNESIKPLFRGNLKQSPYKAVDLGLSVKWCSCNVGADKSEEPGLLFQFGRTDGYKYDDEKHKFLYYEDYVTASGTLYKPGETLKLEDDAAHVNMKGDWRMPTKSEILELYKLPHEYTELNGFHGYEFTGKNGNTLFIPVSGYFNGFSGLFQHNDNYIWSSSIHFNDANFAHFFRFNSSNDAIGNNYRYYGYSVRGVCE